MYSCKPFGESEFDLPIARNFHFRPHTFLCREKKITTRVALFFPNSAKSAHCYFILVTVAQLVVPLVEHA